MYSQRPAVPAQSHRLPVVLLVVAVALTACGGGGGGASPGLAPAVSPPPVNPPSQFATGGKSFTAASDRSLALPLYGISLPFAAVVAPGSIFAGRRLETDNSISLAFESAAGAERSVRFGATGSQPFVGSSADVDYVEVATVGTLATTSLSFARYGALDFTSPASQTVAFYGGFETPAASAPVAGTMSYIGTTAAVDFRGGVFHAALTGSIHLEADFQGNKMYGSIGNLKEFDNTGTLVGDYDHRFLLSDVTISTTGASATFSGDLLTQNLSTGTVLAVQNSLIDGRFFGGSAQEAAGVWQSDVVVGRQIWGSFGATSSTVDGVASFLQSVGTPLTVFEVASFEVDVTTQVPAGILPPGGVTITPLSGGGFHFSVPALGAFNAPGSATSPALASTAPYESTTGATAVTGVITTPDPSLVYVAERGTLSYAKFGYWVDSSRVAVDNVLERNYFAAGVQTPNGSMPVSGTAQYVGTSLGRAIDGTNAVTDFVGKVSLTADFGARSVSGVIDNLTGSGALPLTSIALSAGVIGLGSNTFAGTSSVALTGPGTATGTWNGRFHGPAANEVAGSYTLNDVGNALQVWGSYGAGR